ncbi:subtilisin-like protein [Trametes elegans]|nr:subtilisin-like protein [Trametes elegans]
MFWSSALFLGLVQLAFGTPLLSKRWDESRVKHSWREIPRGWELHGAAPADYVFDMRIGLKQDKIDKLISALYEVSDPNHDKYGQHLSKEDVAELASPHRHSVSLVESWLSAHGFDRSAAQRSYAGDWVTLRVSVAQAERMLGTKYQVFRHGMTGEYVVRTMNYSLPEVLLPHVDVVAPTTYFGTVRAMKSTSFLQPNIKVPSDAAVAKQLADLASPATIPASCNTVITPDCLHALYNTTGYVPTATDKNSLGIAGYLEQYANRADLQLFLQQFRSDAVNATFETVKVNGGGDDQSKPGAEANLDIQYAIAMSYPTPNIYYSTGGSPPFNPDGATQNNTNEPYLDWLNFMLGQDKIPQTLTTSYGDDEQTVPFDYASKVCDMFAQLGARGSTVLFSSGDYGSGAGDCLSNDGKNTTRFQPSFPASCPYVTAVGATFRVDPEVAINWSGGGFSDYFSRPDYQSAQVDAYLNTTLKDAQSGMYNASGRGYPDIAASGSGFQIVYNGTTHSIGGTSASAPTVAGIISLLNDYRLSQNKSSLGFLNPFIYSNGTAGFKDIFFGSSIGCGDIGGFPTAVGWDPVTGLGTPNFGLLKDLI